VRLGAWNDTTQAASRHIVQDIIAQVLEVGQSFPGGIPYDVREEGVSQVWMLCERKHRNSWRFNM
jgi:hypothetical protein